LHGNVLADIDYRPVAPAWRLARAQRTTDARRLILLAEI
jgi:hypothetical protein